MSQDAVLLLAILAALYVVTKSSGTRCCGGCDGGQMVVSNALRQYGCGVCGSDQPHAMQVRDSGRTLQCSSAAFGEVAYGCGPDHKAAFGHGERAHGTCGSPQQAFGGCEQKAFGCGPEHRAFGVGCGSSSKAPPPQ